MARYGVKKTDFTLTALQQVVNSSSRPANELRVSVGKIGVTLTPANSFLTNHKNDMFEVRQESATLGMVGTLLGAPAVTVAEWPIADPGARRDQSDAPKAQYSIPGEHAPEALKTLVSYCAGSRFATTEITHRRTLDSKSSVAGGAGSDARSLPVLPEPDSRDVLMLPFRTERIMLTMVLILAAAAVATCGGVIIIAGILPPRSPIKAAPRRRAF